MTSKGFVPGQTLNESKPKTKEQRARNYQQQLTNSTVKAVTKLIQQGSYEQAKSLIEKTIVEYELNEPTLNMLCGEINMTLGFLIIAE